MFRCRTFFRILHCRRVVTVRRISSNENEKPRNPFRKVVRKRSLVFDYWDKVANRICLSVIGNGAVGEPLSLVMFTDYKSYLFNCGEGTARIFREHDLKLFDIAHIFITHKNWTKMSGLPDMYLNLQNVRKKRLTLHGPPHIEDFFGVTVSYEKYIKIIKKPVEDQVFEDDTIQVQYVTIFASYSVSTELRNASWFANHKHHGMKPGTTFASEGSDMAVCYICKCLPKPRKLSWERCLELNVPLGPPLLELKNGNDITLPSGKKILAEDVLDPAEPGMAFLVVDCPSEHFLDSFISEEKFKPYQLPSPEIPVAVVHFTPPDVFDTFQYQRWISRFSPDTHHLVLNSRNLVPSKVKVHQLQNALNLLHPRIFKCLPNPKFNAEVDPPTSKNIIQAEGGLLLHLRPSIYLDHDNIVVLDPKHDVQCAEEIPAFSESLLKLHSDLCQYGQMKKYGGTYPEVIFLGTGSACSTAYRNCTCILVNVSGNQSIILDCGDGSYQQLVQYFGPKEVRNVLRRISCVFISHHHTDHYMGLFKLIHARKEAFHWCRQSYVPLVVTVPQLFRKIFDNFENMFGPIRSDIRIFRNSLLSAEQENSNLLKKYLGDIKLNVVPVKHCADSYGAVLSYESRWKIVFSGDCSPSQNLIDAGKDCTLLIHEATLEDSLEQEALLRQHSTISQALDVSRQMNAQHTIVTHFSSFYVEVPFIKDSYKDHKVGIAFDNMRLMCVHYLQSPFLLIGNGTGSHSYDVNRIIYFVLRVSQCELQEDLSAVSALCPMALNKRVRLCDLPSLPLFIPVLRNLFSGRLELHQVEACGNAGFTKIALETLRS